MFNYCSSENLYIFLWPMIYLFSWYWTSCQQDASPVYQQFGARPEAISDNSPQQQLHRDDYSKWKTVVKTAIIYTKIYKITSEVKCLAASYITTTGMTSQSTTAVHQCLAPGNGIAYDCNWPGFVALSGLQWHDIRCTAVAKLKWLTEYCSCIAALFLLYC